MPDTSDPNQAAFLQNQQDAQQARGTDILRRELAKGGAAYDFNRPFSLTDPSALRALVGGQAPAPASDPRQQPFTGAQSPHLRMAMEGLAKGVGMSLTDLESALASHIQRDPIGFLRHLLGNQ